MIGHDEDVGVVANALSIERCQHLRINAIGLRQDALRLGKLAHLARIDDAHTK